MKCFFTPREVTKIIGLSYHKLTYWDKSNFIKPSYRRKSKYRLYTFTDLFLLWFANTLNMHKISTHKARQILDTLRNMLPYTSHPLVDLSFLFDGARILIFHGQVVMQEEYKNTWISWEAWELRKRVDELFPITQENEGELQ